MTSPIEQAMAAAKAGASQAPAVVTQPQTGTAVAPSAPRRMPGFSMSDAQSGMECDTWLALNKDGFGITGKAEGYNTPFFSASVTVHPRDVMFTMVCRINETTYYKTNDGISLLFPKAEDPKSWDEATDILFRMKGEQPYPSADIRMTVQQAFDAKGKPVEGWTAGTRAMIGLAKTHWYQFAPFVKAAIEAGKWAEVGDGSVDGEPVDAILGYQKIEKKRTWYVPSFELVTATQ